MATVTEHDEVADPKLILRQAGRGVVKKQNCTARPPARAPRPHAAPLFVACTVNVHEGAAAHDTVLSTLSCPSQRPMEKGRPGGGDTNAHVMVVPTFVVAASSAEPTNVPVGDRSTTER